MAKQDTFGAAFDLAIALADFFAQHNISNVELAQEFEAARAAGREPDVAKFKAQAELAAQDLQAFIDSLED